MRNVGYMHTDLPETVLQLADRERVVEILRIGRIDREGRHPAEIATLGIILLRNLPRDGLGGTLNVGVELVRQVELRHDGMHLRVVVTLAAQTLDQHTARTVVLVAPLRYAEYHLVAVVDARAVLAREVYVHRQLARVGVYEYGLTAHLRNAHITLSTALDNLRNSTLGMAPVAALTL